MDTETRSSLNSKSFLYTIRPMHLSDEPFFFGAQPIVIPVFSFTLIRPIKHERFVFLRVYQVLEKCIWTHVALSVESWGASNPHDHSHHRKRNIRLNYVSSLINHPRFSVATCNNSYPIGKLFSINILTGDYLLACFINIAPSFRLVFD